METAITTKSPFKKMAEGAEQTIHLRRGGGQGPPRTPSGTRVPYQPPTVILGPTGRSIQTSPPSPA